MCRLNKYILNGVETRITLWPSNSKFKLVKPDTITGDFKIKITDIYMHACKVTVAPDIVLAHNALLAKTPAKYPYDRTRILTYALPKDSYLFREDNLFQFEKPDRIILGFVSSAAFQGSYTRSPFNFLNLDVNNIALYVNAISTPAQPMKLTFDELDYKQAYYNLFTGLGKDGKDLGIDISPEEYPNGNGLFAFDLKGLFCTEYLHLIDKANLRGEATFGTALTESITAVIIGKFGDIFAIDLARNIIVK